MQARGSTLGAVALGTALPVALLLLWQVATEQRWISPLFYPAPTRVGERLWEMLGEGRTYDDIGATLRRLAIGFGIGAGVGVSLGLVAGNSRLVKWSLFPTATALYVIPRIALLPLVLVAFGINDQARVFIVAFSVSFICFFNTLTGAEQVPRTHLDVARASLANRWQVLRSVVLPASLPTTFTGLRLGLGYGVIVIISTEFLAADDGIGARIWLSYEIFDFPTMYAGIAIITALGLALNALLLLAERLMVPWNR
jgi:ABC-type nitrate/sulfonate/bicarbonate transport system permease component